MPATKPFSLPVQRSHGSLRSWLETQGVHPALACWNKELANLYHAGSLAEFWERTESLVRSLVPAPIMGLFFLSRELAPPPLIFSTGRHWESLPSKRLHDELQSGPVLSVMAENPGIPIVRWHHHHRTNEEYMRSDHFQRFHRESDLRYPMGMVFWNELRRPFAVFGAFRTGKEGDFSDADERLFRMLHAVLEAALTRVLRRHELTQRCSSFERWIRHSAGPAVLADMEGSILFANRAAREVLGTWSGGRIPSEAAGKLPEAICEVIDRERVALRQELRTRRPLSRKESESVIECHGSGWRARVRALAASTALPSDPHVWVAFERAAASGLENRRDEILSLLTLREREVAECAADGMSNAEIAARLGKSISTVKAQLNGIFQKLGIKSRQRLVLAIR